MVRSRRTAWMAIVTISAAAVFGNAALAADNALKIGILDVAKIYSDAPRLKQYSEQIVALRGQLQLKLDVRGQNLMLEEPLIKELIELKLKGAAATEKDKARITEIETAEKNQDAKLKELQAVKEPTEQQKTQLKALQDLQATSKTMGEALEKDYAGQIQTRGQELEEKAKAETQEAVNKVAEKMGLTLVFVKDAVMFGGTDITDAVIDKLDRKVQ